MPTTGEQFGRYRLLRQLGRGGMGVVYAAHDTVLEREVALKIMVPGLADDPEYRARFTREALALSRVESSHVITVHDHGEIDGCLYLVTQLVPGGDLLGLLRSRGPLEPRQAVELVLQVLQGLSDAHRSGIVHRDVKPSNVLLRPVEDRYEAVLCDFGIATTPGGEVTRTGGVVGSFPFMAPERHRGEVAGVTGDVYSVGCLLWQLLTGTPPYAGTDVEIAMAHLQAPLPRLPGTGGFERVVNGVLSRAMAKLPTDRYASAKAMRSDLAAAVEQAPPALVMPDATSVRHSVLPGVAAAGSGRRRRSRPVLVGSAALAVLLVLGGAAVVTRMTQEPATVTTTEAALPSAPTTDPGTTPTTGPSEDGSRPVQRTRGGAGRDRDGGSGGPGGSGGSGSGGSAGTGGGTVTGGGSGSGGVVRGGGSGDGTGSAQGRGGDGTRTGGSGGGGNGGGSGGGNGGGGGDNPRPQPQPLPEPEPQPEPTYRCWNGKEVRGSKRCTVPTGARGIDWMFADPYGCRRNRASGAEVLVLSCPRKTPDGPGRLVFTEWRSVTAAGQALRSEFGGASSWNGDWGRSWTRRAKQVTRINLYRGLPMSVRIVADNRRAHQNLLDRTSYRVPENIKGQPIG